MLQLYITLFFTFILSCLRQMYLFRPVQRTNFFCAIPHNKEVQIFLVWSVNWVLSSIVVPSLILCLSLCCDDLTIYHPVQRTGNFPSL
jgi:hypothetical protein